ncbi:regulatory protein RecX [Microbacterium sp. MC2]
MSDDQGEPGADNGRGLAPVIPLFGARGAAGPQPGGEEVSDLPRAAAAGRAVPADDGADAAGHGAPETDWHTSWLGDEAGDDPATADDDERERIEAAEAMLLRKLRGRSLSIREARTHLAGHELDAAAVDGVIARFERNGYLDDAKLADQLIHTAMHRKGQGRRVVAQALAQRGIPREVVDAALAEAPDDDAERALEFARHKARTMTDLDRDVALRRLAGQLARRGYGAQALDAARQALDEAGGSRGPRTGVRFT